jgi:hypothetical protein
MQQFVKDVTAATNPHATRIFAGNFFNAIHVISNEGSRYVLPRASEVA